MQFFLSLSTITIEECTAAGAMMARTAWLAAGVALAVGCGGGSGMPPSSAVSQPGTGDPSPRPDLAVQVPPPAVVPADLRALAVQYSDDSEYDAAWGLAQIGAATAYARIARRDGPGTAPGAGARVGVIDTGIDAGHWEFDASRIGNTNARTDTDRAHGTRVASVIAARRDGPVPDEFSRQDFHGVAWGVDLLQMTTVAFGSADPVRNYEGTAVAEVGSDMDQIARWVTEAASVDFVNMSFGVTGLVENYLGKDFGPDYAAAVETLAQPGGRVFVFAAGNTNGHRCEAPEPSCVEGRMRATSPDVSAGLPVLEASLRRHVVAVVATDRDGRITEFSNRCGIAAKWCLAAPGELVPTATSEPDPDDASRRLRGYEWASSGTSFAAPYVTGGLAVLKHWFRSQMANEALLARLYATARVTPDAVPAGGSCPAHLDLDGDRSTCELSSAFGRGVMDLGAATAPVGQTSIALGGRVADGGPLARSSWIVSGRAMGDALSRGLADRQIAVFDALGAPFWVDADDFAQDATLADPAVRLWRWFAGKDGTGAAPPVAGEGRSALAVAAGPVGSELQISFGALDGAHMSFASQPVGVKARLGDAVLSMFASAGSGNEVGVHALDADAHGLALAWSPAGRQAVLRAGWTRETDTLFGSSAEGAFGKLSSGLSFVGASGGFEAGGWRIGLAGEIGRATPEAAGGLLADADARAFSTAFSAEAARPLAGGTLRLSLQQPLRIESGRLHLSLPMRRTPEGAVVRQRIPVGLEPSGRQIDFGVNWTKTIAPGGLWRVGAIVSHEPGHAAGRNLEAVFLVGLRLGL